MIDDLYQISFQPDQAQVEQLKLWMFAENKRSSGFVHSVDILSSHLREQTLAVISYRHKAIGFVTWDTSKRTGHIAVMAIAPQHRRLGVGRYLVNALLLYLRKKRIAAIYLECSPPESAKFWRKLGFTDMPQINGHSSRKEPCLYRVLLESQAQGSSASQTDIQIYPWGSNEKMRWPVIYRPGSKRLVKPIVYPAGGDWMLEVTEGVIVISSTAVKRFKEGKFFHDPFLVMTTL